MLESQYTLAKYHTVNILCSPKTSFEGFAMQNYSLPMGTCSGVILGNLDEGVTHARLVVSQAGSWDATDHVVSVRWLHLHSDSL